MHAIITTVRINDNETVEVITYDFDGQEEVLDFLNDYEGLELSRLYDELKPLGDRTMALIEPHHRKALRRVVSGTSRTFGKAPIEGSITIEARRVA